jgi:uncharacterized protein
VTVPIIPTSGRIAPPENRDTAFFWEGLAQRRLLVQRCDGCGRLRFPPDPACPACHSLDWSAQEVDGRGAVFSWTVLHHPQAPGFGGPALPVVVELDAGVRMIGDMDVDPATLRIGDRVVADFVDQDEGWTALAFRPDPEAAP